ncbi:arginase [Mesorhizobium sp. M7D.F.Ca.US.004.03.1.1]|nr:arginase [Mesorhizobium sp. M7D.F.Ca.US.004.01.2.1]RVA21831.1 arginase [Mesorhizobium sp. M7D.F.Ca.US.004.03.1.1]
MRIRIIGAPVQDGAGRMGCEMGPSALRTAGLVATLQELGHEVEDWGTVQPAAAQPLVHDNTALKSLPQIAAWTKAIAETAFLACDDAMPIFLGGDHSMTAGSLSGVAHRAAEQGRPLFVLWLDAHPDFHTLDTTASGNLHGVPLAYASGQPGFAGYFPDLKTPVDPGRICAMGLRSVDVAERTALNVAGVTAHDMRAIDEHGIGKLLRTFLAGVEAEQGMLHVSLDVDFLDPAIAPAVGTTAAPEKAA